MLIKGNPFIKRTTSKRLPFSDTTSRAILYEESPPLTCAFLKIVKVICLLETLGLLSRIMPSILPIDPSIANILDASKLLFI